ncbi:restriction endonuclease subunit S [Lactobacillus delbrueckii subsp. bulgaricus]|nr:hypothetical protein [Lactobacillus delbrueckii subsp. bulgaricus]
MKDEKKAPKLRFKGFTDDWEQCKLGDVAEIVGGGTPSTKKSEYWNGNINWFTPAEIGNQIFVSHSQKKITELGLLKSSAKILPAGTILFTSRAGIGNTAILTRNACTNQGFQSIVPYSNKLDSYFIYSESAKLKRYGETMGSGSTFTEVSGKQMKKMSLHIPNINEQAKIGNMLKILDRTITLHEEKKRQLERLKSALLQKMFADKSGYPPVRFEGFSDKWEQVKYGEIFQRRSKMGVSTPTLPSVEYDDINPGMGTLNKEPKSKGISKRGIYFNPGDVLFGKLRPYLKNWLFACFEGVAVGDFWVLTSSKIDHGFTYSLIQTPGFQYIANLSSGSKMPRSDWGLVSNARTFIPINHLEQERISSVLFGLDHAITLYEHKLEILNKIKSFLLQNMFI